MTNYNPVWLDHMYNNRALVPEFAVHIERWQRDSAQARAQLPCALDVAYGSGQGETMDIFPTGEEAGQILGEEGLVELVFDYTDFGRALIEFNFYPGISERIDALGKKDFQPITRMQEFIPQLRHLKYQSSCMNSLEFKDQVEKYGDDLLDCLFVLQHPYLFLGYLEDCLKDKKYEIIELFLECGFDPSCPIMNLLNETSNTLLYSAVCDEKIEAVLLLLKWGADPLSTNSLNVSPWALSLKKIEDNNYDLSALSENAQKIQTKLCDYVPQNKVKAYLQAIQIKKLFEDYCDDSRELIAEQLLFLGASEIATGSSYLLTNIIEKLKDLEQENSVSIEALRQRTRLGLLFASLLPTEDCNLPYNPKDNDFLIESARSLLGDFSKYFIHYMINNITIDDSLRQLIADISEIVTWLTSALENGQSDHDKYHLVRCVDRLMRKFKAIELCKQNSNNNVHDNNSIDLN